MPHPAALSSARRAGAAGAFALALIAAADARADNRLGGHIGAVFPLLTHVDGETTTIGDDFQVGFPMGITVKKSDRFAFDLELVPGVDDDPQTVSLTVHPGALWGLGSGFTLGLRAAFDVSGDAWGFTPLLNKGFARGSHTLFVEAVVPIRFQTEDEAGDKHTAVGFGVHLGVGF
jgi:hypothetical protein